MKSPRSPELVLNPHASATSRAVKRVVDAIVASIALVLLAPLLAIIALAIKLESRGPVLFKQQRLGLGFRPFAIYKFRTMRHDESGGGRVLTLQEDDRITRIGRVLRATKVDELPQLLNVVKGEMSLVGPRPEVKRYVDMFPNDYREILQVRPGLTDLASIKYRNEAALLNAVDGEQEYVRRILPDKLRLAREYIRRSSPWFDFLLILRTAWSLVTPAEMPHSREIDALQTRLLRYRRPIVVAIHLLLIMAANYGAFLLRFDGSIAWDQRQLFIQNIGYLIVIRGLMFIPLRMYEGLWRYTGIWDLRNIVVAVTLSTAVFYLLVHQIMGTLEYPRSIFFVDSILLICAMSGVRLARRAYLEMTPGPREKRVLIYGAGDAGEMVVRDMLRHPDSLYEPVGFIDDDPGKTGQRIHGVRVLGTRAELSRVITFTQPSEILVAIPAASPSTIRALVHALEEHKLPITTLPHVTDILDGRVTVSQIRNLSIEDLLARPPIGLDPAPVQALLAGQCVLVTGAGGSIGSELCRQIAAIGPSALVMLDRYENSLFHVINDLSDLWPHVRVVPVIGDITDAERIDTVLAEHSPQIIFHAAAHKHVPLMELNPCEAIKNNVRGTRILAEAAARHRIHQLVLISSDKAVNPSSVMGATKRVAELIVNRISDERWTRCVTVRFGNVLGSNGSVVPRFLEQIRGGGPVTITHPEMRRYFMLIPEAVQLVLHAAAIGGGGATYVLDMGEQIKLVDMARNLIRLSGFVPEDEIPIVFTGLRPGEKLSEELVGDGEHTEPSPVGSIFRVRSNVHMPFSMLATEVMLLERLASEDNRQGTLEQLARVVPTFKPGELLVGESHPAHAMTRKVREHFTPEFDAPPRIDRRRPGMNDRRALRRGGRRRGDAPMSRAGDMLSTSHVGA